MRTFITHRQSVGPTPDTTPATSDTTSRERSISRTVHSIHDRHPSIHDRRRSDRPLCGLGHPTAEQLDRSRSGSSPVASRRAPGFQWSLCCW